MNKIAKYSTFGIAAVASAAVFGAGNASAFTIDQWEGNVSAVTLKRSITNLSNKPTNTFGYTVSADAGNPGTVTLPSPAPSIVFNAATDGSLSGDTALKTTTYSLQNINFPALGDYAFDVVESTTTNASNYPLDTTKSRRFIVSVRNILDANDVPTGQYKAWISYHEKTPNDNDYVKKDPASAATFLWTSAAVRTYADGALTVHGNMAKKDDCFTYQITVKNPNNTSIAGASDSFKLEAPTGCGTNPTTITVGTPVTVQLKHGDTVTIGKDGTKSQLPVGIKYEITATNRLDEYTSSIDNQNLNTKEYTTTSTAQSSILKRRKEKDPVTGILLNIWPYVLMMLVAGTGAAIIISKKKKSERE